MARRVYKQAYHGTYWPRPRAYDSQWEPFTDLDSEYSDYGAVWFTQVEEDAEWFVKWRSDSINPKDDTSVMFRAYLSLPNSLIVTARQFELKALELDEHPSQVQMRDFWEDAPNGGFDAVITPANYRHGGDDIAVFSSDYKITGIKIKLPGQDWTDYMETEAAVSLFKQFWGWTEDE